MLKIFVLIKSILLRADGSREVQFLVLRMVLPHEYTYIFICMYVCLLATGVQGKSELSCEVPHILQTYQTWT